MRLALWQCAQHAGDVAGNLARLRATALHAAAAGAQLLVTPEMVLTGYNIGAPAVQRLAEAADGPSAQTVSAIAAEAGIAIAWGFPERRGDGAVHNAAQLVDAGGRALGTYRKTHLYGALERSMFAPSDGANPVFDLGGWRIGLLICYDVEFPEAVRGAALQGAGLVVVPTANMQGFDIVPRTLVPARAYENGVFVAYANGCGHERGIVYGGRSAGARPDGRLDIAGTEPTLMLVDIDRGEPAGTSYLADRRPQTYGVAGCG